MIMMNSEIHKDRMKPENIEADIGRDQWEYANAKYIGTGKGFNSNITQGEVYNSRVQTVGREEEGDESLMRASGPTNIFKTTGATPSEEQRSLLTEENVVGYSEFSTIQVLEKEFSLGKDLLDKAVSNINQDCFDRLVNYQGANEEELETANVFFKVLAMLNNSDSETVDEWANLPGFNEVTLTQLEGVATKIEGGNFEKEKVDKLREEFKMKNDENQDIQNLREFLCESFCLIEIVQELHELKNKVEQERNTLNVTLLF